jgi:crotonobetainyl-CoA:carnitine CoA-transferase CaiB-like acyl-CoA transferase
LRFRRSSLLSVTAARQTAEVDEREPVGDRDGLMDGLLTGIRVLDLTVWRPGPYATQLLAEIGADVVKVEPPGGDPMRSYPGLFLSLNANKRSVMLDLKADVGRHRALELAAEADVIIEGFRPGVAERLGIGYRHVQAVNPTVVYCSISGMGQDGPLALASGHDLNYQAWAGSLAPEGGAPVVPGVPIADLAGGMAAAFGICAAVIRRLRSGEGERIDVAMTDVLVTWTGAARAKAASIDVPVGGVPGYGAFETGDRRHIALGVLTEDHFWRSLCDALGMADCRDLIFADRLPRQAELQERIAQAVGVRTRDELVEGLLAVGVPVSPVLDRAEMLGVTHFRERSVVTKDPWSDPATGYPVLFQRHPAGRTRPPPDLDEHSSGGFKARP